MVNCLKCKKEISEGTIGELCNSCYLEWANKSDYECDPIAITNLTEVNQTPI